MRMLPCASRRAAAPGGTSVVASYSSTRSGPGRSASPSSTRVSTGVVQGPALAPEVGAPRPAPRQDRLLASRTGRRASGRTSRAVTRRLTTWIGSPAAACPYVRTCSWAKAAASESTPRGAAPLRRDRDRQLERLALVLEIDAPLHRHRLPVALGAQERLGLPLERVERGGHARGRLGGERAKHAPHEVMLALRLEEADRAEDAGRGRDEHRRDPERARHLGGEERPVAAEGDEDELPRVAPALDRHRADRAGHARAAHQVDAVRGRLELEVERPRHLLRDRRTQPSAASSASPLGSRSGWR